MSLILKKTSLAAALVLGSLPSAWACGGSGSCGGGGKILLCAFVSSLLLMALGYAIAVHAGSQKKPLSQVGKTIGMVILFSAAVMFFLSLFFGWCAMKCAKGGASCGHGAKAQACHHDAGAQKPGPHAH